MTVYERYRHLIRSRIFSFCVLKSSDTEATIRYPRSSITGSLSYANYFIVARFIRPQENLSLTSLLTTRKKMELMLRRTILSSSVPGWGGHMTRLGVVK